MATPGNARRARVGDRGDWHTEAEDRRSPLERQQLHPRRLARAAHAGRDRHRTRGDGSARGTKNGEVEDDGCGIAEEALERIFDRFGRAAAARTRSAGGVGLGLAIVDAIAKRHGGNRAVRSTPSGLVFAVAIRRAGEARPALAQQPSRQKVPDSAWTTVVDSDTSSLKASRQAMLIALTTLAGEVPAPRTDPCSLTYSLA